MSHYLPSSLLLASVVLASPVWAQAPGGEDAVLPTVEVSAPRLARELYATPAAVSTLESEEIAQGQQRVRLDEALNRVPGCFYKTAITSPKGNALLFAALARVLHLVCVGLPLW